MAALAIPREGFTRKAQQLRSRWLLTARPEQVPPPGMDWDTWLIMAGRGFGKTRAGAEWLADQMVTQPDTRWAIVAPTIADARDTCVEGESGVLACLPDNTYSWHRSLGELILANGARAKCFAAEEPNRLRGPQHHGAWCDEVSSWRYEDAWDQLQFGLRLGKNPRVVCTTTPKPNALTRTILSDEGTVITRGSTFDNVDNLAAKALKKLKKKYEGTRLGRQELNAELLDDAPGALWTRGTLEVTRVKRMPGSGFKRVVVGVDPSGSAGLEKSKKKKQEGTYDEAGDSQGIVAVGLGYNDHAYVISDDTINGSPLEWGQRVVNTYQDLEADLVVAEKNYGGEMVRHVIKQAAGEDNYIPVKMVNATRGKAVRAEPCAMLYEQNRVHHVGTFAELEDQMCNLTPTEYLGNGSPDRLDALVWCLTELMLGGNSAKIVKVQFG